ncbi:MAG TPA: hypothetical protein VEU08_10335 [Vicinamibacterales bacterium]|nr:hypothetical protein [Vicinamibacterales bacterium]
MPLVPSFDERIRRVLVRGSGVITLTDIVTLIRTARAHIDHRMWPMLVDARGAGTDLTTADVDRLAAAVQDAIAQGPRGHVAIVADDEKLYSRMLEYEAKCAAFGVNYIRVFRLHPDAERWLDIVAAARHFG